MGVGGEGDTTASLGSGESGFGEFDFGVVFERISRGGDGINSGLEIGV